MKSKTCKACGKRKPIAAFGTYNGSRAVPPNCKACETRRRWNINYDSYSRRYGISKQEYNEQVKLQRGRCYICGQLPKDGQHRKGKLQVDHDHNTGRVRGIICGSCNTAIGHFKDSIALLKRVIDYLENPPLGAEKPFVRTEKPDPL